MIQLIILVIAVFLGIIIYTNNKKKLATFKMPVNTKQLLVDNVAFYTSLSEDNKLAFEKRITQFLELVLITGVGTLVEDIDRILIASGAIIPIFAFPDWMYNNIDEVLLYKDDFNTEYSTDGTSRNILGMVGDGALHRQMILSQPAVRQAFKNATDGHNTVIHEFVHLIDKADGEVDGVPAYLLSQPYIMPWLTQIHTTIKAMQQNESKDINFYGATNDAEFFAVVSEYFFEKPMQLKTNHPELYSMLEKMFTNAQIKKQP